MLPAGRPEFPVGLIITAILAPFTRQTNIFWTAVFLGGLEFVRVLKAQGRAIDHGQTCDTSFQGVITRSWKYCQIYDVTVGNAYFEG